MICTRLPRLKNFPSFSPHHRSPPPWSWNACHETELAAISPSSSLVEVIRLAILLPGRYLHTPLVAPVDVRAALSFAFRIR